MARVNQPKIADAMLLGVKVGGSPYWPTSFRWGYGWPYLRGYKPLSPEERQAVQAKEKVLAALRYDTKANKTARASLKDYILDANTDALLKRLESAFFQLR